MKLEQRVIDFVKLVLRSPDLGDGWRNVAPALRFITKDTVQRQPELFDFDGERIRLTERGAVVSEYL